MIYYNKKALSFLKPIYTFFAVNYITISSPKSCNPDDSRPLVLILGWLGAQAAHLRKYQELYNNLGYSTITYNPKSLSPLFPTYTFEQLKQISILKQKQFPQKKLIIHALSNVGVYNYAILLNYVTHIKPNPELINAIQSAIFDSGPSELSLSILAGGYTGLVTQFLMKQPNYSHPVINRLVKSLFWILLKIPYFSKSVSQLQDILYNKQPSEVSQLYIYSTEDKLIPYTSIEQFIHTQSNSELHEYEYPDPLLISTDSNNKRLVIGYKFPNSPHVQHSRVYPNEYKSVIQQFLNTTS